MGLKSQNRVKGIQFNLGSIQLWSRCGLRNMTTLMTTFMSSFDQSLDPLILWPFWLNIAESGPQTPENYLYKSKKFAYIIQQYKIYKPKKDLQRIS